MKFGLLMYIFAFGPTDQNKLPICGGCQHLMVDFKQFRCRLYGNVNVVTGEISYGACTNVRSNSTLCGPDGKFFVKRIPFTSTNNNFKQ